MEDIIDLLEDSVFDNKEIELSLNNGEKITGVVDLYVSPNDTEDGIPECKFLTKDGQEIWLTGKDIKEGKVIK